MTRARNEIKQKSAQPDSPTQQMCFSDFGIFHWLRFVNDKLERNGGKIEENGVMILSERRTLHYAMLYVPRYAHLGPRNHSIQQKSTHCRACFQVLLTTACDRGEKRKPPSIPPIRVWNPQPHNLLQANTAIRHYTDFSATRSGSANDSLLRKVLRKHSANA